jgi:membrane protein implicated in regulation of membrane protease activity
MDDWQWLWWLGGALLLGAVEMMTVDFIFLMLAGGALAAAIAGALGGGWVICAVVFCVVSVALLVTLRPFLLTRLKVKGDADPLTGTAALVGKLAEAVTAVDQDGGRVKLVGEVWTARTSQGAVINPGQTVTVVAIEGATAVVAPNA